MKTITREKLAEKLSKKLGFSSALCEEIIIKSLNTLVELTIKDEKLTIQNFGTWRIKHKSSRPGFNITTKEAVIIEPKTVLRLIPSKVLKEKINN